MKIVVLSVANQLLAGALSKYLNEQAGLLPIEVPKSESAEATSITHQAGILLMEVQNNFPFTLASRMESITTVRQKLPTCKIVLLCDEKADPDLAKQVIEAKKQGWIDNFFYSSVSGEYLSASLASL